MNLHDFSLRTRISAGLLVLLLVSLTGSTVAWWRLNVAMTETVEIEQSWLPAVENLALMQATLGAHLAAQNKLLVANDASAVQQAATELRRIEAKLAEATKVYTDTLDDYAPEDKDMEMQERSLYANYDAPLQTYLKAARDIEQQVAAAPGTPETMEAVQDLMIQKAAPAHAQALDAVSTIVLFNLEGTAEDTRKVVGLMDSAVLASAVAGAILLIIGLGLVWVLPNSITAPLARAISQTEKLAKGDLSTPLSAQGKDETAQLLRALEAMRASWAEVTRELQSASDAIANAASEIATGNADLSSRTEQAAANLEQTASSMDELTHTVSQTAEAARTANRMAGSASESAARGGEVMNQVSGTMEGISGASRKIADIIGVIDGIAFQTNILALNAAVEAARAGEQGRGFAVVASEVRSLAGRSAEAAREIKALIGASVEQVTSGSELVAQAVDATGDIGSKVQQMTDIVGQITAATTEQADGIQQVNAAVVNLDQMTQQNAALVEQSTAAAESLKEQAVRLSQLTAAFKIS